MESIESDKEIIEITGDILYRRKMGKHLCFVTLVNEDITTSNFVIIKNPEVIKTLRIGDKLLVKGFYIYHNKIQNIESTYVENLGQSFSEHSGKRKIFIENISNLSNTDSLCSSIKKGLKCLNPNCKFRHTFNTKAEEETLAKNMHKKLNDYNKVHSGDPFQKGDKQHKNLRNSEFADFLVKTYGLETLRNGVILDIAGGKGITSFYLTTKYNLKCKIIDPRGTTLAKNYAKQLYKSQMTIDEERIEFHEESCSELIKGCSLLIGMHPDEATVDIVKAGIKYKLNFAVVPCCVFHKKFPDRRLKNGKEVVEYNDLIQYLKEMDDSLKEDYLKIEGRNRILYKIYSKDQ